MMILHSEVMILNSDIHWNMTKQTCWSITIQYDHWSFQHGNHHLSVLHFLTITVLVGGAITILKNMSSSMGRMTSHIWNGKSSSHVWNHQPAVSCAKLVIPGSPWISEVLKGPRPSQIPSHRWRGAWGSGADRGCCLESHGSSWNL